MPSWIMFATEHILGFCGFYHNNLRHLWNIQCQRFSSIFLFHLPYSNPWESCDFQRKLLLQTVSKLPRHHQIIRLTVLEAHAPWHSRVSEGGIWQEIEIMDTCVFVNTIVPVNVIMSVFYRKYIPTRWYSAAKENHCPKLFIHFIQVLWHLRVSILPST